jgi:hypothetical protein
LPSSSGCISIDVAGRDLVRLLVAWLYDIEVCGRWPYPGREPGPTLLEKLPFDVFRDDAVGGREDTEEEKDEVRDRGGFNDPNFCYRKLAIEIIMR